MVPDFSRLAVLLICGMRFFPLSLWLLSGARSLCDLILSYLFGLWSALFPGGRQLDRPRGVGFQLSSAVGFWPRTHCEPGLRTRPALHFRSFVVPFCVGSWQALENSRY